ERRYEIAYEYMLEGRYSPETQLGVLSLEDDGAPSEGWGKLPDFLAPVAPQAPLA
ncbi:MAG: hypothetical protein GWO02_02510, partial [Gammaproteobacteria bacterium]|nr:hypothetical protein [Gammaproteobacteria bacterium]